MGLAAQKNGKRKLGSAKNTTAKSGTKQRIAKMGKRAVKGQAGIATAYITRTSAIRRLQLTLKDFRRLCILKGIYPRDPKKSQDKSKTYYHVKDIQHLAHEPLLAKFREFKGFMKKVRRAVGRRDVPEARRKHDSIPTYTLHHLVKERYPRFTDALRDLDDALCTAHLFAALPAEGRVVAERTANCVALTEQWTCYCAHNKLLRRAFISVKGVYLEAMVKGERVTWLVPHKFTPTVPKAVDFRVMLTFLEFYETMIKFTLFRLFKSAGMSYPPSAEGDCDHPSLFVRKAQQETNITVVEKQGPVKSAPSKKPSKELAAKLQKTVEADEEEQPGEDDSEGKVADGSVFSGLKFFLSRECMHPWLEFIVVAGGGDCGWDLQDSPYGLDDPRLTHRIVDRPSNKQAGASTAELVQPQWVVDSFNAGVLLPVSRYAPGATLPPHLSPFVDDVSEGYVPEYRLAIDELKSASAAFKEASASSTNTAVKRKTPDADEVVATKRKAPDTAEEEEEDEEEEVEADRSDEDEDEDEKEAVVEEGEGDEKLEHIMMSKKAKRLYSRMQKGIDRKKQLAEKLKGRAQQIRKTAR